MAEYLNYGNQQIELLALLTNLANSVLSYVASLPWSRKRKERFMNAYTDIKNRGIKGASDATGEWVVDVGGGTIPLDLMDIYGNVAHFIRNQMASLPTRASEEDKKSDISKYGKFTDNFIPFISNVHYGGNDIKTSEWSELDERDSKTGIRSTAIRQERLANYLEEYLESLKDKEYNFEDSAFSGIDDLKTRLNTAITKLRDKNWNLEDKDALNALGLNYSDWFNNGSGDLSDMVDANGNRLTWAQKALYKQALDKQKLDLEVAKQKELASKRFTHMRHYPGIGNLNGTQLTNESLAALLDNLNNFRKLDNNDLSGLAWAIKNGNLIDVPKEELNLLAPEYRNNPKRLKKVSGIEGIYYDTIGQRLYQPYSEGLTGVSTILDIIGQKNLENSEEYKQQKAAQRKLKDGWETEDYSRIVAALGDIAALGGFWANVGGSAVSLIADTTADLFDESLSGVDVIKNLGRNIGWTAAGFIPGGKLGKVSKNMLRWGPKLLVLLNNYNLLKDESNKNTWKKLTTDRLVKEGLTSEDLRNITYWARALTGTVNAAKSTARDIKYSKARGTNGQEFITKNGNKVKLSNADVDEINSIGARKGLKAAEELFKSKTGEDVADNTFKFTENGRKGIFKDTRSKFSDQRLDGKTVIFRTPELLRYYDFYSLDRMPGRTFGGWRPFWNRGTSSYFDHFDNHIEFKNPLKGIFGKLDPYKNIPAGKSVEREVLKPYTKPSQSSRELPPVDHTPREKPTLLTPNPKKVSHTEAKKLIRNLKKGKFSNELPKDGTITFRDAQGNTIEWKLQTRDNDFLFSGKSTDGTSFALSLNLDNLKSSIYSKLMNTFNSHRVRSKIELPAYVAKLLLGTAYNWFKQGGKIADLQINKFLKQYK